MPGACCNRRGFSAEKESLCPHQNKSSTRKGAAFVYSVCFTDEWLLQVLYMCLNASKLSAIMNSIALSQIEREVTYGIKCFDTADICRTVFAY